MQLAVAGVAASVATVLAPAAQAAQEIAMTAEVTIPHISYTNLKYAVQKASIGVLVRLTSWFTGVCLRVLVVPR